MNSYSSTLAWRSRFLGIFALALIGLAAFWLHAPTALNAVFTPEKRIEQVIAATQALRLPPGTSQGSDQLPCRGRALKVLQAHLMTVLQQDFQATDSQLRHAANRMHWSDCAQFTQAFNLATRMSARGEFTPEQVKAALSEDISWTRQVPCLLGGNPKQAFLLSGSQIQCRTALSKGPIGVPPSSKSYREQARGIANTANMAAISGRWSALKPTWVTLEPTLQGKMDEWTNCMESANCGVPELSTLRNVAIVVLDARTGAVLVSWCHGPACERAREQGPGVLPATMLEAPPASTAKLLFAMAMAANPNFDAGLLQRQIKTSGQNDARVSKRNEWWEKQAICANQSGKNCPVPQQTLELARALGWNAHCDTTGRHCGRWGLLDADTPGLLPGMVGRLALSKLPKNHTSMLEWQVYDDIRQGKRRPLSKDKAYDSTSLSVQAVLGAGDSRVSALGLASLPMQIWRVSQELQPIVPYVISSADTPALHLKKMDAKWRDAARTVLGGMRKVVQPPEPGWQGSGTAMPAWMRVMQKSCDHSCGVWAKTGTVSKQDKVFGGTTTMAALVDTREWSRWSGVALSDDLQEDRVLAVGVIAMPHSKSPPTHAASFLGISLMHRLLSREVP